uniref:Uncharacterized protein n=1 Tax=Rhizophora mucronata TaxID=61149 RepID=A0A2P2N5T5_RHIMU
MSQTNGKNCTEHGPCTPMWFN